MIRTLTLALTAAATVAAAAAIPTAASAADWNHRHYSRPGVTLSFGAPYYAYAHRCYTKRHWVRSHGHWVRRIVRVCR